MATAHTLTVDGDDLVAVHHAADSDDWIVFSHGFVSDKEGSYEGRSNRAVEEGYNAVRFDHRGCGESDLSFAEQTLSTRIADLRAVLEYFDPPSCVLFGSSFGGKVCFHTAVREERVTAVATRAPVTYNDVFDHYRPGAERELGEMARGFFEDFDQYPFDEVTQQLDIPVVIFHGRDDATVPIDSSLAAVDALEADVLLQQYVGEGHNFSRETESRLREHLFWWLDQL